MLGGICANRLRLKGEDTLLELLMAEGRWKLRNDTSPAQLHDELDQHS
jgi:hypothetical protein